MEIVIPPINKIITNNFIPSLLDKDAYIKIFTGGRGTRKSTSIAIYLIYSCITLPYFKCLIYRDRFNSIRNSSFALLCKVIAEKGLDDIFQIKESTKEIICTINGHRFIPIGADTGIKSIDEVTHAWIEEEAPENENDETKLISTVRSSRCQAQIIYTINPEAPKGVDYQDFWFYKKYFQNSSNPENYSSEIIQEVELNGEIKKFKTIINHSFYFQNPYLPESYKIYLESQKLKSEFLYRTNVLGLWSNKVLNDLFYKNFDSLKNVENVDYNENKALYISVDFNTKPYCSMVIGQMNGKYLWVIDEITTTYPKNNIKSLVIIFIKKYPNFNNYLYVSGDSTGKNETVIMENYTQFGQLKTYLINYGYKVNMRVAEKNPPLMLRGEFINAIFSLELDIKIIISPRCSKLILDLKNVLENPDGGKEKRKVKDPETGQMYEQFGHLSDGLDYIVCEVFKSEFAEYKRRYKDNKGMNIQDAIAPIKRSAFG